MLPKLGPVITITMCAPGLACALLQALADALRVRDFPCVQFYRDNKVRA